MISNFTFILYITDFLNQLYQNQTLLELYTIWPFTDERSLAYKLIFEEMRKLHAEGHDITETDISKMCVKLEGFVSVEAIQIADMICRPTVTIETRAFRCQ